MVQDVASADAKKAAAVVKKSISVHSEKNVILLVSYWDSLQSSFRMYRCEYDDECEITVLSLDIHSSMVFSNVEPFSIMLSYQSTSS